MSKACFGGLTMDILSKHSTKEEIRAFLSRFTDEDFNGNNGEDYFIEIDINGKTQLLSRLDACMHKLDKYDNLEDFIAYVLKCNYSDSYYTDYDYKLLTLDDNIIVSLSTQYS